MVEFRKTKKNKMNFEIWIPTEWTRWMDNLSLK